MHNGKAQGRRATSLLATATLLFSAATLATALSPSALIIVESLSGGAGNNLSNITLSIPLSTLYTNPALDTVSILYLTGATGADTGSITCYPFQDSDLTNPAGQPFSQFKPSRLSTNTVQVGSIVCNSTSTSIPGYNTNATGVTSTLQATSTQLTRGSVSDVPNLGANVSVPLGPGPVILSSTLLSNTSSTSVILSSTSTTSSNTTSSTSTSLPTVTNASGGGGLVGPPRTVVTSVTSVTPSEPPEGTMVTEMRTEVVVSPTTTTTSSSAEGSSTAVVQGSQGAAAGGKRIGSWATFVVAGGFGLVGMVVLG